MNEESRTRRFEIIVDDEYLPRLRTHREESRINLKKW